ncbi:MAG: DUF5662 family protein [Mycobacteriales bacterium]
MKPHLRYLKYVLLHKFYVYQAGILLAKCRGEYRWRMFWRLIWHDFSKFSRAEWGPYVRMFYGRSTFDQAVTDLGQKRVSYDDPTLEMQLEVRGAEIKRDRQYAFNVAWLHHQHVNDHHWQHWLLREDLGANLQLLPPAIAVDEMVADWVGAGSKILAMPHLASCINETVQWYAKQYAVLQLRPQARDRVEGSLYLLAEHYGLPEAMTLAASFKARRVTSTIELRPGVLR